jgi:16S rRNA (uracil1498-N3)-methyltransferase
VRVPRFLVPGAGPGADARLPPHSAHHARDVLRLRPGSSVRVFDGSGAEWLAEVQAISRREVRVRVGAPVAPAPESPLRTCLGVSVLKGDRMEWVIQKATELGVSEIAPLITARTDTAARPALAGSRRERWHKVAAGAAEQCGRARVPVLRETATLDDHLRAAAPATRLLLLEPPAEATFRDSPLPGPDGLMLLVGPNGGWDPAERVAAEASGFRSVGLGTRVLRAETAAVAAVAAAQLLWGDLS